jgi:hypothetical protein
MRLFSVLLLFPLLGCSCSSPPKLIDPQNAIDYGDLTAIMSGCGQQLASSGYLICRENEGKTSKNEYLVVHTPPGLDCESDTCTYVRVFFPDGRPTLEKSIPKGQALIQIPWSELINKDVFDLTDRGFFSVSVTTHYKGPDNTKLKAFASGMVFMHVVRKAYTSLIENEDDENFTWIWKTENNQTLKVTTGWRVYVEPHPKHQSGSFAPW